MKPKHIAGFSAFVLAACALSSFITYRLAMQHNQPAATSVSARPQSQPEATDIDQPRSNGGCFDLQSAASHLGNSGCVTGRLLRAYTSRSGNTFLDFCSDYRDCPFTSVIFASDKARFGDLSSLNGRQVEIHGRITSYQGRAEIIVRDPGQITLAE